MERCVFVDKDEIVLLTLGKRGYNSHNVHYKNIVRVTIEKGDYPFLKFFSKPAERISVEIAGMASDIAFIDLEHKKLYPEYKEQILTFAKDHKITIVDKTQEE
jgi:hypothetical protein